jgi:hypothetical protein
VTPQANWRRCRPLIVEAIASAPGFETIEDVEKLIGQRKYSVLFGDNSAAVIELAQFQQRRVLIVQHGGGDLGELLDVLEPALCNYARTQGCDGIMGLGRLGWKRAAEKRGYRMAYMAMIKDLTP